MYKSNKNPNSPIANVKVNDNSVDIKLADGREIRVCLNGPYNPNRIKVVYHSHEWDWESCEFTNFEYPSD